MTTTSTFSPVVDRLLELAKGDAILNGIQREEADLGESAEDERLLILGMEEPSDQEWAAIGGRPTTGRNEAYTIAVLVAAHQPGQTAREARVRLHELVSAFEALVRANAALLTMADLPGLQHLNAQIASVARFNSLVDDGFRATAEVRVLVHARI